MNPSTHRLREISEEIASVRRPEPTRPVIHFHAVEPGRLFVAWQWPSRMHRHAQPYILIRQKYSPRVKATRWKLSLRQHQGQRFFTLSSSTRPLVAELGSMDGHRRFFLWASAETNPLRTFSPPVADSEERHQEQADDPFIEQEQKNGAPTNAAAPTSGNASGIGPGNDAP